MVDELFVQRLREHAEWAEANIWEVPIILPDDLRAAADALEEVIEPMGIEVLGLSTRAYCGLYRWGLRLAREVAKLSMEDLLKIPGIGENTAQEIMEKITEVYHK